MSVTCGRAFALGLLLLASCTDDLGSLFAGGDVSLGGVRLNVLDESAPALCNATPPRSLEARFSVSLTPEMAACEGIDHCLNDVTTLRFAVADDGSAFVAGVMSRFSSTPIGSVFGSKDFARVWAARYASDGTLSFMRVIDEETVADDGYLNLQLAIATVESSTAQLVVSKLIAHDGGDRPQLSATLFYLADDGSVRSQLDLGSTPNARTVVAPTPHIASAGGRSVVSVGARVTVFEGSQLLWTMTEDDSLEVVISPRDGSVTTLSSALALADQARLRHYDASGRLEWERAIDSPFVDGRLARDSDGNLLHFSRELADNTISTSALVIHKIAPGGASQWITRPMQENGVPLSDRIPDSAPYDLALAAADRMWIGTVQYSGQEPYVFSIPPDGSECVTYRRDPSWNNLPSWKQLAAGPASDDLYTLGYDSLVRWQVAPDLPPLAPPSRDVPEPVSDPAPAVLHPENKAKPRDSPPDWRSVSAGLKVPITRLIVDSHAASRVFALADGQIFRSDDGALNWQHADMSAEDGRLGDFALDVRTGDVRYAVYLNLLARLGQPPSGVALEQSTAGDAAGWTWLAGFSDWTGAELTSSPSDPNVLYLRSLEGHIARSRDAGKTCDLLEAAPPAVAIALDPNDANSVYVLAQNGRVFHTRDGGSSFDDISGDLPLAASADKSTLALDPNEADSILVALGGLGLFRSRKGGTHWEMQGSAAKAAEYTFVAFVPGRSGMLYVGTDARVLRSSDGGSSFERVFKQRALSIAIAPGDGHEVYLGTDAGVYRGDGGSFVSASAGLYPFVSSIATDMHDPGIAYLADRAGLYVRSKRDGIWTLSWPRQKATDRMHLIVDPNRAGAAYARFGDSIMKTDDVGATWQEIPNDLHMVAQPPFDPNTLRLLAVAKGNSDLLYGSISDGGEKYVVLSSSDAGHAWHELYHTPSAPQVMIADSREHAFLKKSEGFFVQTGDSGKTWQGVFANMEYVYSFALDPSDPQVLYAFTDPLFVSGMHVLRKSVDGGHTWLTARAQGLPPSGPSLAIDGRGHLYAQSNGALFVSADGADTFGRVGGPSSNEHFLSIAAGPDCVAYAVTSSGIFMTVTGAGICPLGN